MQPATVGERIRLVLSRFLLELVRVLCFAGGSIGAFLHLAWPPQLRRLVLGYLFAFLILRVTLALCHFLFAPAHAELRVVPMNDAAASSGSVGSPLSSAGSHWVTSPSSSSSDWG